MFGTVGFHKVMFFLLNPWTFIFLRFFAVESLCITHAVLPAFFIVQLLLYLPFEAWTAWRMEC